MALQHLHWLSCVPDPRYRIESMRTLEDAAIRMVRYGARTQSDLERQLTGWAARRVKGSVGWSAHPGLPNVAALAAARPAVRRAILRMRNAGIILRDPKWPHHIKLGV